MLDYTISLLENALEVFGTLVGDSKHCNIMVHIFAAVEAEEGKLQQLLQFLRILGHQNLSCLLQVQDSQQPFPQVLLFHTNPCYISPPSPPAPSFSLPSNTRQCHHSSTRRGSASAPSWQPLQARPL